MNHIIGARHGKAGIAVFFLLAIATLAGGSLFATDSHAYQRYNGGASTGCQTCHGTFTSSTSPKGTNFGAAGNKHDMHRNASFMGTACGLCHVVTGDNPLMNSSAGSGTVVGVGCTGCHNGPGLRQHHRVTGASQCSGCHASPETPPAESTNPPYYGTSATKANNACNPVATALLNENWTSGDFLGLDNDGDNLYDSSDPNCASVTAGPMTVTPAGGLTPSGTVGGPFTPSSQTYTVTNTGTGPMNWTATKAQTWVTLSAAGGTLAAGANTTVTVSIGAGANSLAASGTAYTDTVTFTNTSSGTGNATRPVSLTVNATNVAGPMTVTPAGGLTSSGTAGGPFSPSSQTYTVTNTGAASMNWTATKVASWVTLSSAGGTLAAGANTTVTVSIGAGANSLAASGTAYTDTVTFTNTSSGTGNATRPVSLTVNATNVAGPMTVTPAGGLTSSGTAGGPFSPSSQTYTVTNTGAASMNWTATKVASWVTLSSAGGTLAAGANTTVTASIGAGANSLAASGTAYTDTVTFTNTSSGTGNTTRPVSLTVNATAAPTISTVSLPAGAVNTAYSQTLAATGGTTPYSWSVSSGTLPAGLSLSAAGVLDGMPTAEGTSSFTVRVAGANSASSTKDFSVTINAAATPPPITLSSDSSGGSCSVAVRTGSGGSAIDGTLILAGLGLTVWGIRIRRRRG